MWWLVAVSSKWQGGYSASHHHQPRQPSSGYNIQSLCPLPSPRNRLSPISLSTLLPPNPLLTCHFSPLCPDLKLPVRTQSREIHNSRELTTGSLHWTRIAVSNVALCLVCNALFAQFLHEFTQAWHYGVTTCLISANFSAMELQITSSTCTTLGARKGKLRLEILNCFYEDEF